MPEDKLREKSDKYKCPENCPQLQTVRVNPELWNNLRTATKSRDLGLQRVQLRILKSLTAVAQLADKLLAARKNQEELNISSLTRMALDSFVLGASAIQDLNIRRRDQIKPDLNKSYQQLCSSQTPVTKYLFGDDLGKAVKDITESNRLSHNIAFRGRGRLRGGAFPGYHTRGKGGYRHFPKNGRGLGPGKFRKKHRPQGQDKPQNA